MGVSYFKCLNSSTCTFFPTFHSLIHSFRHSCSVSDCTAGGFMIPSAYKFYCFQNAVGWRLVILFTVSEFTLLSFVLPQAPADFLWREVVKASLGFLHLPLSFIHTTSAPRLGLLRGPFAGSDTDMWVGGTLIRRNHQTLLLVLNLPRRVDKRRGTCPRRKKGENQEQLRSKRREAPQSHHPAVAPWGWRRPSTSVAHLPRGCPWDPSHRFTLGLGTSPASWLGCSHLASFFGQIQFMSAK